MVTLIKLNTTPQKTQINVLTNKALTNTMRMRGLFSPGTCLFFLQHRRGPGAQTCWHWDAPYLSGNLLHSALLITCSYKPLVPFLIKSPGVQFENFSSSLIGNGDFCGNLVDSERLEINSKCRKFVFSYPVIFNVLQISMFSIGAHFRENSCYTNY